jgi:hypothetical protein
MPIASPIENSRRRSMFRRFMPLVFLALNSALAAASQAQTPDVASVSLTVTIARSPNGSDGIDLELRVVGTGLNNGTLTAPTTGASAVALQRDGTDLVLTDSFANEAELNALLPSGNYQLRINSGTVTASLAYARPAVPSPAITEPDPGGVVAPGAVQIEFSACPVCNLVGDSVTAELEDAQGGTLDEETLTSSSVAWTPQGATGPLLLPERASFLARVTHSAVRQANTTVTADADGTLLFTHEFVQSDEVAFETGFTRPEGHVCIAASYTAPPVGCKLVTDAALQVLDPSGAFAVQVAGFDLAYTLAVAPNGAFSGTATGDLDDNGTQETSASLGGRLRGAAGEVRSRLAFVLVNEALSAKLKVKQRELLSIAGGSLTGTRRARGRVGATTVDEETPTNAPLPFAPLGWLLEFDIDDSEAVQSALLTLENGRSFGLAGNHRFRIASGLSSFKLRSADERVRVKLSKLTLDDATVPLTVTGGTLRPRILGQRARTTLP